MGLSRMFVPQADTTAGWRSDPSLQGEFEFDFDRSSLSGVRLADPAALLWKLGPSEDQPAETRGTYNYCSRGAQARVEDGRVASFILFWKGAPENKFAPFGGRCIFRG